MKNKKIIISILIMLIPIVFGLLIANKLPNELPIHWDINGNIDGYLPKYQAIIYPNILIVFIQLICIFFINNDSKNKKQNQKIINLIYWLLPFISLFFNSIMYLSVFNVKLNIVNLMVIFFGIIFMIIGNYLPKCLINTTIGIRLPWTLNNEDVWNKTHRFTGVIWFFSGLILLVLGMFNLINGIIFICLLIVMIIIPIIYSYSIYKKLC